MSGTAPTTIQEERDPSKRLEGGVVYVQFERSARNSVGNGQCELPFREGAALRPVVSPGSRSGSISIQGFTMNRARSVWSIVLTLVTSILATGSPESLAAAFTQGNVVVYRVGDGTSSLANTGNAVFLDE